MRSLVILGLLLGAATPALAQSVIDDGSIVMRRPLPDAKGSGIVAPTPTPTPTQTSCDDTRSCPVTCEDTGTCTTTVPGCTPGDDPACTPTQTQVTVYKFEMGAFGGPDSTCSYDVHSVAVGSCTKNGQPTPMMDCLSRSLVNAASQYQPEFGDPTQQTSANFINHLGDDYSGCKGEWHYVYRGYGGTDFKHTGTTRCGQDSCGNLKTYHDYPVVCYMVDPAGNTYEVTGNEDTGAWGGYIPKGLEKYPTADAFCTASAGPKPPRDTGVDAQIACTGYGSETGELESHAECAGPTLGTYKVSYAAMDFQTASDFCSALNAECCTWRSDAAKEAEYTQRAKDYPDEGVNYAQYMYWTIEAHSGFTKRSLDPSNNTFSETSLANGSDFANPDNQPKYTDRIASQYTPDNTCLPPPPPAIKINDNPVFSGMTVGSDGSQQQCSWFCYNDPANVCGSIWPQCIPPGLGPPRPN